MSKMWVKLLFTVLYKIRWEDGRLRSATKRWIVFSRRMFCKNLGLFFAVVREFLREKELEICLEVLNTSFCYCFELNGLSHLKLCDARKDFFKSIASSHGSWGIRVSVLRGIRTYLNFYVWLENQALFLTMLGKTVFFNFCSSGWTCRWQAPFSNSNSWYNDSTHAMLGSDQNNSFTRFQASAVCVRSFSYFKTLLLCSFFFHSKIKIGFKKIVWLAKHKLFFLFSVSTVLFLNWQLLFLVLYFSLVTPTYSTYLEKTRCCCRSCWKN